MLLMDWRRTLRNSFATPPHFNSRRWRARNSRLAVGADILEHRAAPSESLTSILGGGFLLGLMSESIAESSLQIVETHGDRDSAFAPITFSTDEENSSLPVAEVSEGGSAPIPDADYQTSVAQILPSALDEIEQPTSQPAIQPPVTRDAPLQESPKPQSAGVRTIPPPALGGNTHPTSKLSGDEINGATAAVPETGFQTLSSSSGGNSAPIADDDTAWTGINQEIMIYVLNGDTDVDSGDILTVIDASGASKGIVTPNVDHVIYTPDPGFISGSDTFTYTVSDGNGGTDTATVTVNMVNVTGWSVEWKDSDGVWHNSPTGEAVWTHDELRWTAYYTLTTPAPAHYEFAKQDWDEFMQGGTNWSTFTDPGDPASGNPGAGIWAIAPAVNYSDFGGHQSGFVATMTTAAIQAAKAKPAVQIQSIAWVTHTDANHAGILDSEPNGDVRFYPDAVSPGGNARNKVDLEIEITPQVENVKLYLHWFDVDDATDHDGPLDSDPPLNGTHYNNTDNFATGTSPLFGAPFPTSVMTDNLGKVRKTIQINWIQPGNNFRIAASHSQQDISLLRAKARDNDSRLLYDHNQNTQFDGPPGLDAIIDDGSPWRGIHTTPVLTVWRKLRLEVDSMRPVQDNMVLGNTITKVEGTGLTRIVTLDDPLDADDVAQNRFQGGNLHDVMGNDFVIVSSTQTTITVNTPAAVPQVGIVTITDDDEWQDGEDVPNPDVSEVQAAFEKAFVTVLMVDPSENPNPSVDFRQHLETGADVAGIKRQDTAGQNSTAYWVAYLLAAFQGPKNRDNDFDDEKTVVEEGKPPEESPIMGWAPLDQGVAIIFMETDHDVARESGLNIALNEQDTVVHELGHLVGNSGDEPVSINSRYTKVYLKHIRSSQKPAG